MDADMINVVNLSLYPFYHHISMQQHSFFRQHKAECAALCYFIHGYQRWINANNISKRPGK